MVSKAAESAILTQMSRPKVKTHHLILFVCMLLLAVSCGKTEPVYRFEIIREGGFDNSDIESVKSTDCLHAEGMYRLDVGEIRYESLSEYSNSIVLTEGRLPVNSREVLVSSSCSSRVGEKVIIDGSFLVRDIFNVTGVFEDDSKRFVFSKDAFDRPYADYILLFSGSEQSPFINLPQPSFVEDEKIMQLENLKSFYASVFETELGNSEKALNDARDEFSSYEKALSDAETELAQASEELISYRTQLDDAKAELEVGLDTLNENQRLYDLSRLQFNTAIHENHLSESSLESSLEQVEQAIAELEERLSNTIRIFFTNSIRRELQAQIDNLSEMRNGLLQLIDARDTLAVSKLQLEDGRRQYEESLKLYLEGESQYEGALEQYREGLAEYESKKGLLEDSRPQLMEAERAFSEYMAEYTTRVQKADDAIQELEKSRTSRTVGAITVYGV